MHPPLKSRSHVLIRSSDPSHKLTRANVLVPVTNRQREGKRMPFGSDAVMDAKFGVSLGAAPENVWTRGARQRPPRKAPGKCLGPGDRGGEESRNRSTGGPLRSRRPGGELRGGKRVLCLTKDASIAGHHGIGPISRHSVTKKKRQKRPRESRAGTPWRPGAEIFS